MSYFSDDEGSYSGGASDDDSDIESVAPVVKRSNANINLIEEDDDEAEVIGKEDEEDLDDNNLGEEDEEEDVEDIDSSSDINVDSDDELYNSDIDNDNEERNTTTKKLKEVPKNLVYNTKLEDDSDSNDDDDDDGDQYLQKFDKEINKNYIMDFHPECVLHNYDEIAALTNVVRNKNNVIIDPLHKTIPFLTKYEKARILGQRAKQINSGATPFVKVPENVIDGYLIAELELAEKRIPFIIRRPLPNGGSEYWNIKDLEIVGF
jgi:DNA-directed RNA polymerase I, II, and III subunit RPABC2